MTARRGTSDSEQSGTDTAIETDSETGRDTTTTAETDTDTSAETLPEANTATPVESEPEPKAKANTVTPVESEPEPKAKAKRGPNTNANETKPATNANQSNRASHGELAIEIDSIDVSFGDDPVLEDVSFDVDTGEFVGLVGPNGAGKTTLLRIVSGALTPDDGTVTVDGVDVHAVSSAMSSRLVSVVPQDTSLSFSFPVRDIVAMGRYPHRSRFSPPAPEDRALVDRALERTRTSQFADRSIDEISGGERQRVVLARAVAQDAPVLLLDEPTASLDVNHQIEMLELVRKLVEEGNTVVAAIHDLDIAARYCDRLVLLANRTVYRDGTPSDVLTPESLETAFGVSTTVVPNPVTGTEAVTAFPDPTFDEPPARIHVLGSGTTAAGVIGRLDGAGVRTTVGPVTSTDVAFDVARRLDVDAIQVEPFTSIPTPVVNELVTALRRATVTVLVENEFVDEEGRIAGVVEGADSVVIVKSNESQVRTGGDNSMLDRLEAAETRIIETTVDTVLDAITSARTGSDEVPTRTFWSDFGDDPSVRASERPSPIGSMPNTETEATCGKRSAETADSTVESVDTEDRSDRPS